MNMPPPPAGLNTAIPEASESAKTLKERLQVHMEDPSCAGCHALTDVIGFGFEQFDGLGLYRVEENGGEIDPSGELDGESFSNAQDLTTLIAEHPSFPGCFVRTLYSYATGHESTTGEEDELQEITRIFEVEGRVLDLMSQIAISKSFRRVGEVAP